MAEIFPFPNAVADALEHYARLSRAGIVKGVVIAAKTDGAEALLTEVGVDDREVAALITELQDARLLRLLGGGD